MADGKPAVDDELDNLLDSTLKDFDDKKQLVAEVAQPEGAAGGSENADEDFKVDVDLLRETMKSFMAKNPIGVPKDAAAGAAGDAVAGDKVPDEFELSKAMEESLKIFADSIQRLNQPGGVDFSNKEFFSELFGGSGPAGEFLESMQSAFQGLLSKELIYPGLKDLETNYPAYLEENESTLSKDDLDRYRQQLEVVKKVCGLFEEETPDDSEDKKKQRMDQVLEYMTEMQKLGDPPKELIKNPDEALPDGLPDLPAAPPECNQQ